MIAVRRDVVSETRDTQRPWEQGSLIERFEFVPDGARAAEPEPAAAPSANGPQVAALERSVGDTGSIEDFLRSQYLAPDTSAMRETVSRLYADPATIFGTPLDAATIVKVKTDWFAQFASWSFELTPGSLVVTPRGRDRAEAVFAMAYEYVPKDKSAARLAGRARVSLELVMTGGEWRIASEMSEALR
jgi:uncharacterized caspase-like protein